MTRLVADGGVVLESFVCVGNAGDGCVLKLLTAFETMMMITRFVSIHYNAVLGFVCVQVRFSVGVLWLEIVFRY